MADNCGVIYHHRNVACYIRLCVSIYSLRKHYDGPVTIMQEGHLDDWMQSFMKDNNVDIQWLPEHTQNVLVKKTELWKEMPYDYCVYLDADTVVQQPIDELFAMTKKHGYVSTWFTGWKTDGVRIVKRLNDWKDICPEYISDAISFGKAVNGGIQGWSKNTTILPEYTRLTKLGNAAGKNRIVLDEVALQLLIPQHKQHTAHHKWNTSGKFGAVEGAAILHYHGRKHAQHYPACEVWKRTYWEMRNKSPYYNELGKAYKDKRFGKYLKDIVQKDVTIVTAADKGYIKTLEKNMKDWMKSPGLREQQFIVFVNSLTSRKERKFLDDYKNVKVVRWSHDAAGDNVRERMLSSFIFGAAKHVKTKYMMKLDADCRIKDTSIGFDWDATNYKKYKITSHRWGYTRVKGDPDRSSHWLNRLDDWWGGTPLFEKNIDPSKRYGHKRIQTICSIEDMEFIRKLAKKCGDRLPIPSQDTTTWYAAAQLHGTKSINRINMRKWYNH